MPGDLGLWIFDEHKTVKINDHEIIVRKLFRLGAAALCGNVTIAVVDESVSEGKRN